MRVTGFDLGIRKANPAAAVTIEIEPGGPPILIESFVIPAEGLDDSADWEHRTDSIGLQVAEALDRLRPDLVCYEAPFMNYRNPLTYRKLSALEGMIRLAAAQRGIQIQYTYPKEVKKRLTGDGDAKKPAMVAAFRELFGLAPKAKIPSHIADGGGIALAGLDKSGILLQLREA